MRKKSELLKQINATADFQQIFLNTNVFRELSSFLRRKLVSYHIGLIFTIIVLVVQILIKKEV